MSWRPRTWWTLILSTSVLIAVFAELFMDFRGSPEQAFLNRAIAFRDGLRSDAQRQLDEHGAFVPDSEAVRSAVEGMVEESSRLQGPQKDMATGLVGVLQTLQGLQKDYQRSASELDAVLANIPTAVRTRDDIRSFNGVINDFEASNGTILSFLNDLDVHCKAALSQYTLPPLQIKTACDTFVAAAQVDLLREMRSLDRRYVTQLRRLASLIENNLGRLQVNQGQVLFPDVAGVRDYNDIMRQLFQIMEEQERLQRELVHPGGS